MRQWPTSWSGPIRPRETSCSASRWSNIERWLANGQTAPNRLEQWRQIILRARQSQAGFRELSGLLRDGSEVAVHLKSFDPFPGVLTTLERREILLRCAYAH